LRTVTPQRTRKRTLASKPTVIHLATEPDREEINRLRQEVYSQKLGQLKPGTAFVTGLAQADCNQAQTNTVARMPLSEALFD
jgi:hypothetical protein